MVIPLFESWYFQTYIVVLFAYITCGVLVLLYLYNQMVSSSLEVSLWKMKRQQQQSCRSPACWVSPDPPSPLPTSVSTTCPSGNHRHVACLPFRSNTTAPTKSVFLSSWPLLGKARSPQEEAPSYTPHDKQISNLISFHWKDLLPDPLGELTWLVEVIRMRKV